MPRRIHRRAAPTVTLLAREAGEEAQARWWRPIAQAWPAYSLPPALQVLDAPAASDPANPLQGTVALVIESCLEGAADRFKLLDRLADAHIPALVLRPENADIAADHADGVILMSEAEAPALIAATLAALSDRQHIVESLAAEVRIGRRFQSGLRGEIDKIHEELQLAASVQREFLPRELPAAAGLDVQVLFRPCGYVSGDIYDLQRLDEHHIGFFVADAVGHGVPAALMTMVLCRCLITTACEPEGARILPPSTVLQNLNRSLIQRHTESPRFATAVYGVIDTRTREVTLSGAGHPHPLRIRAGEVHRIETEGGLLGIFAEDTFADARFTLGPDEMLVVYSDGFETAFPSASADDYGRRRPNRHYVERFAEMADAWTRNGLAPALRTLVEQIDQQSGSLHQVDDLTAMIIVPRTDRALDRLFSPAAEAAPVRGACPLPA